MGRAESVHPRPGLRRGRRRHRRLRHRAHPRRREDQLEDRAAGSGPPRLRRPAPASRSCCPPRASPTTTPSCCTAATTTGSPPTPTGTSSCTATPDVKLIDGGRKKWELDGRALVTDVPDRVETSYTAKDQDLSIRALRDEVVAAIGAQNLVDVRSPDEFSGKLFAPAHLPQEAAQRAGHIPTALNVPWSKAANEDGTFRSDAELTELYAGVGLQDDKDTIAYCRIGERSSHTWFVLTEILGKKNVKNYDGSWTEYGSLVGVPGRGRRLTRPVPNPVPTRFRRPTALPRVPAVSRRSRLRRPSRVLSRKETLTCLCSTRTGRGDPRRRRYRAAIGCPGQGARGRRPGRRRLRPAAGLDR